jgi:arylsulfatase A-like enzyme
VIPKGFRSLWVPGRVRRIFFSVALTLCGLLFAAGSGRADERPNIVVIQTDDQNARTVRDTFRDSAGAKTLVMPNTLREIFRAGTEFRNYYATSPICAPSRASLLTGQYPHNSGLTRNVGPTGGWQAWRDNAANTDNLAVTLQQAGYRTSHFGKFTNGYFDTANNAVETTVPPGWDNWFTESADRELRFYGYRLNDNGMATLPFGQPLYGATYGIDPRRCDALTLIRLPLSAGCNYLTDNLTRGAVREIRRNADRPLYMQVDFPAPHNDSRPLPGPQPATRHLGSLDRTWLSRPPNYNEADISDKSSLIQSVATPRIDKTEADGLRGVYRNYAASLRAVDEGVGAIIRTLRETGELDNTYIFFLSDHGYFLGEHRFSKAKFLPYDASARVAMAVRGPGVPAGTRSSVLAANVDIAPTALQLAGVAADADADGQALEPFWSDPRRSSRRPIGFALHPAPPEDPEDGASVSAVAPPLSYQGFVVGPYKYFRFDEGGEAELYDMRRDPWELENVVDSPEYVQVRQYMEAWLPRVSGCAGDLCRSELPRWPEPSQAALSPEP